MSTVNAKTAASGRGVQSSPAAAPIASASLAVASARSHQSPATTTTWVATAFHCSTLATRKSTSTGSSFTVPPPLCLRIATHSSAEGRPAAASAPRNQGGRPRRPAQSSGHDMPSRQRRPPAVHPGGRRTPARSVAPRIADSWDRASRSTPAAGRPASLWNGRRRCRTARHRERRTKWRQDGAGRESRSRGTGPSDPAPDAPAGRNRGGRPPRRRRSNRRGSSRGTQGALLLGRSGPVCAPGSAQGAQRPEAARPAPPGGMTSRRQNPVRPVRSRWNRHLLWDAGRGCDRGFVGHRVGNSDRLRNVDDLLRFAKIHGSLLCERERAGAEHGAVPAGERVPLPCTPQPFPTRIVAYAGRSVKHATAGICGL